MSAENSQSEHDVLTPEDIEIPIKRTTGDTLEERLTANAYHNILPARYLKKDEDGNLVETQEDLFKRIGRNVALAEAVYELERQDETFTVTPDLIKPNHHARGRLAGEVFGFDSDEFDEADELPKSLEEAEEHLAEDEVELTEDNVNKFAYETLIEELPADIRSHVESTAEEYTEMHENLKFIANSPTLMNAGDDLQQLSACFVNSPEDDMDDIHETAKEAAKTFKSGGGMGYAFWQLRPTGDPVGSSGGVSSGPITFMNTYDQMCETVAQGGTRRGAQMGVMRVSHPDVIEFIHAKNKDVSLAHTLRLNDPDDYTHTAFIDALDEARELIDEEGRVPEHLRNAVEGHLSNFNISVGITDGFMEAVKNDEEFTFTNPRTGEAHIVTEQTEELYEMFGYGEYVEVGEELSVPAREIWDDIIDGAHENGEPGVIYLERANKKHSFDVEEHPEHRILATNPCVAEGTLVNTPEGYKQVEDVSVGDEVSTVIGSEPVSEIETHRDKEVKRVRFSDGSFLDVTEDHIFNLLDGKEVIDTVRLKDVEEGDTVRLESTPIDIEGTDEEYQKQVKRGILLGDGCYAPETLSQHNVVKIASNEEDVAYNDALQNEVFSSEEFNATDTSQQGKAMNFVLQNGQKVVEDLNLTPAKAHEKDFDVTEIESKQEALGLLDGLLASDGNVNLNSTHPQIRWDTSSYEMAQSIRKALLLLGVHGRISISDKADRGGEIDDREISANYDKHTVQISGHSAGQFAEMSKVGDFHEQKGSQLVELQTDWMTTGNTWKAQIESIEEVDEETTVYDLYCEESDTWVTSGYVSRGCGEQPLEEYEACNLGHINFSTLVDENPSYQDYRAFKDAHDEFDSESEAVEAFLEQALDWEEFNHRIEYGTRFLEDVVTMSDFPIDKIEDKVASMRKIGLGIMGYAQMLVQLGIQYGSEPANEVARQMMTHMNHESKTVSHRIATSDEPGMDRGVFSEWDKSKYADPEEYDDWFEHHTGRDVEEWGDGFPLRNHNTTTIAPTGTTSMVGNTTGGCEPMFNVAYMKNVSDDVQGDEMLVEFDDYFLRTLEANDIDIEPVKEEAQELMQANEFEGAQDLETVPEEIAELFITTSEISGLSHASVQCAFQDGVDSSISKTANFPNDATKDDMREVYEYIYENGGKGVTVYRDGTRSKQVLTTRADNAEFADSDEFTEFLTQQVEDGNVSVEDIVETLQEEFDVRATEQDGQLGLSEYRKRPDALVGMNQRINTGYGTLYVWISEDAEGNMFEVFASIGKAGGYTQSFTEALCRMISMSLRYGVPPQRIVRHLSGIQSPKVAWENQEQVASVADGIAMAMDNYIEHGGVVGLLTEMRNGDSDIAETIIGSQPPENMNVKELRDDVDDAIENGEPDEAFEVGASVELGADTPEPDATSEESVDDATAELVAQGESPECPDCGAMQLYYSEGCKTCEACGWSEC